MRERRILRHMPQKQLPLNLESVVEYLIVRHIFPLLAKLEGILNIRIPHRSWRINAVLRSAFPQTGHCTSQRAINLQTEEFIPVHAKRPGRVDLCDDAAIEFKRPISRIVRRALVASSLLI